MAWVYLFIAGLLEVAWAIGLKYTDGFRRPVASVVTVVLMIGSFYVLSLAIRTLPIGTGYAVWTGIGALGTAILGIVLFHEPVTLPRVACLVALIGSIVGLKFTSGH
ncbi:MAG TPA: multidrug efflux SMR transporter [Tepidisphaeraceae bacterium]|nr:multidrug efflux SMR transporter [Tepidisphaeraceae bacterium]